MRKRRKSRSILPIWMGVSSNSDFHWPEKKNDPMKSHQEILRQIGQIPEDKFKSYFNFHQRRNIYKKYVSHIFFCILLSKVLNMFSLHWTIKMFFKSKNFIFHLAEISTHNFPVNVWMKSAHRCLRSNIIVELQIQWL